MPFDAAALNLAMNEIVSSTIQLRLHTGDPGAGANGNANEVQTSGGYARPDRYVYRLAERRERRRRQRRRHRVRDRDRRLGHGRVVERLELRRFDAVLSPAARRERDREQRRLVLDSGRRPRPHVVIVVAAMRARATDRVPRTACGPDRCALEGEPWLALVLNLGVPTVISGGLEYATVDLGRSVRWGTPPVW